MNPTNTYKNILIKTIINQKIKTYEERKFNWYWLSQNPNITWDIVKNNPDKPWDWYRLSKNPNITWDVIKDNLDKP